MALDGVVAEVIYPTFGLFIDMIPAADLQMACAQVYNDWLAETFLHRPDVFIPSAIVPVRDVASAAAELERVVELGFRAATIPTTPPVGHAVQRSELRPAVDRSRPTPRVPLSLHTGTGALPQHERGPGGAVINYVKVGLALGRDALLLRRVRACSNASPTCASCSSRPARAGSRTAANAWTRRSRNTSSG